MVHFLNMCRLLQVIYFHSGFGCFNNLNWSACWYQSLPGFWKALKYSFVYFICVCHENIEVSDPAIPFTCDFIRIISYFQAAKAVDREPNSLYEFIFKILHWITELQSGHKIMKVWPLTPIFTIKGSNFSKINFTTEFLDLKSFYGENFIRRM